MMMKATSHKRKVTFVLPGRNRSGGVRVTVEMANRLLRLGYDVRIAYRAKRWLTPAWSWALLQDAWLKAKGYTCTDWIDEFEGRLEMFFDLRALEFSTGEVVIAVGMYTVHDVNSLDSGVKKVRYNHGFSVGVTELTQSAWGLPMSTIVVASTLIPRMEKLSGQKVHAVVPNGLDRNEYFVESGIRRDGIGIMFSSHPNKAPESIIQLVRRLREKWPDIPHYYYGTDARPKGLESGTYVRYPSVAEARRIYNKSLVWLSTSREEGFCLPILEAMACGCAVVSADNLGALELIRNGENGFLVPIDRIDPFMEKIAVLLKSSELRERIVERGCETVRSFAWEEAVDRMDSFLKRI